MLETLQGTEARTSAEPLYVVKRGFLLKVVIKAVQGNKSKQVFHIGSFLIFLLHFVKKKILKSKHSGGSSLVRCQGAQIHGCLALGVPVHPS